MANATATLKVNPFPTGRDHTQMLSIVYGTCTISAGGNYVTGGIPLNWTNMQDGNFNGLTPFVGDWGPKQKQPQNAWFYTVTNAAPGYTYVFDEVHNTLRINSGTTELTSAQVPTPDTIQFCAEFIKSGYAQNGI